MAVTINGTSNTITGLAAGGLPDNTIDNGSMADDAIGVAELSATGTASSSTYLRGDNSWATVDTDPTTTSGTNNFTIADGDLIIGTAGHGISFAADGNLGGMDNELMDDYEEGTWTPTFNVGYTSITYVDQKGGYIKVGNLVTVWYRIGISAGTANSNAFSIGPMPFTSKNWHGAGEQPMGGGLSHNKFAEFTNGDWYIPYLTDGDVNVSFNRNGDTTVATATNISGNKYIQGWMHFAT